MLSYDKWKLLNESLGRTGNNLGIHTPKSLGIISNQYLPSENDGSNLEECGCKTKKKLKLKEDEDYDMEDENEDTEDVEDVEVDAEEFDDEDGDETVDLHAELSDEDMEDEDEDMEDEDEDMEDEDEDMEDEDMEDEDMEDEDEDMEDEDEDMEEMHPSHKHMEMPEAKKLPKGMISETAWWTSVKSMIGNMSPNGDIKTESTAAPAGEDAELDEMLDRVGNIPPDVKPAAKIFLKAFYRNDSGSGSRTQLFNLIDLLLDVGLKKAEDKASLSVISNHLKKHLNTIAKMESENDSQGAW